MSDGRIQSHAEPRRYLKQHVAEVCAAAQAIVEGQPRAPWLATWAAELVDALARLHDMGKGSAQFQRYIADPGGWGDGAVEKSHAPLSLVLTTRHARAEGWAAPQALAAALAVRGHHGGLVAEGEDLYRGLADDLVDAALRAQLPTVDRGLVEAETGVPVAPWDDLDDALDAVRDQLEDWLDDFRGRPLDDAVRERFLARAAYAVLLEADKAFLAVERERVRAYLRRDRAALPAARVDEFCDALPETPMDGLRREASAQAREGFARNRDRALLTLTLPTGAGKTLVAARWALADRQPGESPGPDAPAIIVALPMLSIVDQTERVWRQALRAPPGDGATVLASHSLSERRYDSEADRGTADFFLDTWRGEVVVTTFDQLLLAMYSDRARHAMRYHRLLGARVVLDEVQCVPPRLWEALSRGLAALADLGGTRVLAMSATPPRCVAGATEVLDDPRALYRTLDRYRIELRVGVPTPFEGFVALAARACDEGERVLVTVNTRASAQAVWEALDGAGVAPLLLSGDMTPRHRLAVIDSVRRREARVVVSTQCVEAGVDLDMDRVLRDLAPLDALVQIAGRCNRHGARATPGVVTVVDLRDARGRCDSALIYDGVLLDCTRRSLAGRDELAERDVYDVCEAYFGLVAGSKSRGRHEFERWARIRGALDVRGLLRGEGRDEVSLIVAEQDPGLEDALRAAFDVGDPWERRSTLRGLAPRVAAVSVTVAASRAGELRTRPVGAWTFLEPGQYHPVRGLISRRRSS